MKVAFVSLGCAKNLVNTEQMMALVRSAGHEITAQPEGADAAVLNTCGFIDSAKSEAIQNILELAELKKEGKLGKLLVTGCLSQRYQDELMEELREQGISRIEDVKYAVLENSGQLSVFPWTAQQPPTAEQLGLDLEDDVTLPVVLINDGRILRRNLTACGRNEAWLRKQLSREKVSSPREVFLLTLDEQGQVLCVRKEREP
mgnify:CR=1 FL=1